MPNDADPFNPDNLTPAQVGNGWRLLTWGEVRKALGLGSDSFPVTQFWTRARYWYPTLGNYYTRYLTVSTPFTLRTQLTIGEMDKLKYAH